MEALRRFSIFALGLTLVISNVKAQDIQFKPDASPSPLNPSVEESRNEPSAIEYIGAGLYLIADDKNASLAIYDAPKRKLLIDSQLIIKQGLPNETKWEAMAKDDQGYFCYRCAPIS